MAYDKNKLATIRLIANYQFGKGAGEILFPEEVKVELSPKTGKVRHVYLNGKLLATLRPRDGLFALTIEGAYRLRKALLPGKLRVIVKERFIDQVAKGSDVFHSYVAKADPNIIPGEEVIVEDERGELLAIGRAVVSGSEMGKYKVGIAVKVRQGSKRIAFNVHIP